MQQPVPVDEMLSHILRSTYVPPLHLICQHAVLLVLTVFDPAWPLSIEGDTGMMGEVVMKSRPFSPVRRKKD